MKIDRTNSVIQSNQNQLIQIFVVCIFNKSVCLQILCVSLSMRVLSEKAKEHFNGIDLFILSFFRICKYQPRSFLSQFWLYFNIPMNQISLSRSYSWFHTFHSNFSFFSNSFLSSYYPVFSHSKYFSTEHSARILWENKHCHFVSWWI